MLKLNNHPWKKYINLIFCRKKRGPNQWGFWKRDSSSLFVYICSSKRYAEIFFWMNGSQDI